MSVKPSEAKKAATRGKEATKFALTLLGTAVLLLVLMVALVPRLVPFDVFNQFYYPVLLVFGLAGAAILTAVLKGYAHVSGEHLGWRIQLGGAAAITFLVVAGGYFFLPRVDTFDLTVRPRAPDFSTIMSGSITAEFGNKTEKVDIHGGEADFKGIARKFWGKEVQMHANIGGYSTEPQSVSVTSDTIDFLLQEPSARVIRGQLNPAPANPQSVRVLVLDDTGTQVQSAQTPNATGQFQFSVNKEPTSRIRVGVCMSGKLAFDDFEEFASGRTTIIRTALSKDPCPF